MKPNNMYIMKWLPPSLREEAASEEPQRFAALVSALSARVDVARTSPDPDAWHAAVIPFIPLLNNLVDTERVFELGDVVRGVRLLLEVVLATRHDLEVQVRSATALTELLFRQKRVLSGQTPAPVPGVEGAAGGQGGGYRRGPPPLTLDWQPLYDMMLAMFSSPAARLEGMGLAAVRQQTLFKLVAQCRRYFPPEGLLQVWARLQPAIAQVATDTSVAHEALGWLALFAPTHNVCRCEAERVNEVVRCWMAAWGSLPASPTWSGLWVGLLARLARDDWQGIIDWQPHLSHLFTEFIAGFDLPVGNATSVASTLRHAPAKASVLFATLAGSAPACFAQLAVHLLRTSPARPHTAACAGQALAHLRQLAALLDNYLHPSNTGKWCRSLATWLKHMAKEAMKQLERQGPAPVRWAAVLAAPERTALARLITRMAARAQFSKDKGLSSCSVEVLGSMAYLVPGAVLPLVVQRFRSALDSSTAPHQLACSIQALAVCVRPLLLSGWAPGAALPGSEAGEEEEEEEEEAEGAGAGAGARQLIASAAAAAAALGVEELEGLTGPQLLSEALVAVLPGLDANDEEKTLAVVQLLTAVLSCGPQLGQGEAEGEAEGGAGRAQSGPPRLALPLYVEEWGEELISRCTALMAALDAGPGHRADQAGGGGKGSGGAAFLTGAGSQFMALAHLLLSRTPPQLGAAMARHIAAFALNETLPGVVEPVCVLVSCATHHHPTLMTQHLARPLITRIAADLAAATPPPAPKGLGGGLGGAQRGGAAAAAAGGGCSLSAAQEVSLGYWLEVLRECVFALDPGPCLQLAWEVQRLVDACFQVPSRPLHQGGASLLGALMYQLTHLSCDSPSQAALTPTLTVAQAASPPAGGEAAAGWQGEGEVRVLDEWVDRQGDGVPGLTYTTPPPEALEAAEQLLAKYAVGGCSRLQALLGVGMVEGGVEGAGVGGEGAAGTTVSGGVHGQRLAIHAELSKMKGVLLGALACLRDFTLPAGPGAEAAGGAAGGPRLAVLGRVGLEVGAPGVREQLATSLAAVGSALLGHDSETLGQFLAVAGLVMCPGSHEYLMSQDMDARNILEEPAAAGLLLGGQGQGQGQGGGEGGTAAGGGAEEGGEEEVEQEGGRAGGRAWRRRAPRWVAAMRVVKTVSWRESQAVFRHWSTASAPELPSPDQLPLGLRQLLALMQLCTTHALKDVRSAAIPLLDLVLKRFPCLAPSCLPHYLAALAGLPPPPHPALTPPTPPTAAPPLDQMGASSHGGLGSEFLSALAGAALDGAGTGAAAAGAAAAGEGVAMEGGEGSPAAAQRAEATESEVEGLVAGACSALNACLAFWRCCFRQPPAFTALLHALLASRCHNNTRLQANISSLMLSFANRFVMPASLEPNSPAATTLAGQLLHLAHPNTLRSSWRYSLSANVLVLMVQPPPSAGPACLPFARHLLEVLASSNMQQLRQLAAAGLGLQLSRLLDAGEANPELVSLLSSWLSVPGHGAALARHLAADHGSLEASDAASDKRGAGLMALHSRLLNMTHEELFIKVVQASLERQGSWPEAGVPDWQPEAVREGLWLPAHAALVQQLARLAPGPCLAALRPALEGWAEAASRQQAAHTGDKAEQGAAAEVMGGLLAAAAAAACQAPPGKSGSGAAGSEGGGVEEEEGAWLLRLLEQQVQGSSLELSEAWALTFRFGVHGLMQALCPPMRLVPPPVPSHGALLPAPALTALADLLRVLAASGPALTRASRERGEGGLGLGGGGGGVGSGSLPAQVRRLKYQHQVARELSGTAATAALPSSVRSFWMQLLRELTDSLDCDLLSNRQQLGKMAGLALSYWGGADKGSSGVSTSTMDTTEAGSSPLEAALAVTSLSDRLPSVEELQAAAQHLASRLVDTFALGTARIQVLRLSNGADAGNGTDGNLSRATPPAEGSSRSSSSSAVAGSTASVDRELDVVMVDKPRSPSLISLAEGLEADDADADVASGSAGSDADTDGLALSRVGMGLGVCLWAAFHGDAVTLRPLLVALLPHLFRLQELAGPVLQKLAHDAQMALALAKYLPPCPGPMASSVIQAIEAAAGPGSDTTSLSKPPSTPSLNPLGATPPPSTPAPMELETPPPAPPGAAAAAGLAAGVGAAGGVPGQLWSTRGAALSHCQYFWFRACFLLQPGQTQRLQTVVLARLADSKPEVRSIASATLSGMLRGLPPAAAQALRSALTSRALQLFSARRGVKRQADAGTLLPGGGAGPLPGAASLVLEKHGVVQGLKAFLQSVPYDCPPWLPAVLLALLAPASAAHSSLEAAVRGEAAKALSEFKRTHEQDSLAALRAMMDPDDWDQLQQTTSSATYFS